MGIAEPREYFRKRIVARFSQHGLQIEKIFTDWREIVLLPKVKKENLESILR